jgi:TonB family protein
MKLAPPLLLSALAVTAPALAQETPPADAVDELPAEELPIVEMPQIAEYVQAPYPEEARKNGIEGKVTLIIELDETGAVTHAEVSAAAGNGFDEAALQAVQSMKFTPARTAEGPVPVAFEFTYGFTLQTEPAPSASEAPAAVVNVEGAIREMGTRRRLEGVQIAILGAAAEPLIATTDALGHFVFTDVPAGTWTLRVASPEHLPLRQTIDVIAGEKTTANLWIRAERYGVDEAVGLYRKEQQEVSRTTLSMQEVRRIPGTFGDPVKVIQTLPGAARSPFGTGLLVIRGSNPEDSGVYVDGVRIPIIYHLTGTTSVIAPEFVDSVDYLPGGFGVQYGRSTGGVVDLQTKNRIDDTRLTWGTDILDSQLYFQGKLGKNKQHGIAVGARRSYIDALLPLVVPNDFTIRPLYWDYQLKYARQDLDQGQVLSAFVYGFRDTLRIGAPADVARGNDPDAQGDIATSYESHRAVIKIEQPLAETLKLRVTPSIGVDLTNFNLGNGFRVDTTTWLTEVRAELPWTPADWMEVLPGVDFIGGKYAFTFASPFRFVDLDDPLAEREAIAFDGKGTGLGPDLYLKANLRPLKNRDRWLITPGVRYNLIRFDFGGSVSEGVPDWNVGALDPRLISRFQLNDAWTFKGSTGLYHQPPQPQEIVGLGADSGLGYERSWANSVGFEHNFSPAIHLEVEGFYKTLDQLVVFNPNFQGFGDQTFVNEGEGKAYGVEFILRHAKSGPFFGWISYTLSRSFRRNSPDQEWVPFEYDQPHILSAQGGVDLPRDWGLSAQIQYVTGNPSTPYNSAVYDVDANGYNPLAIGTSNSVRLPPFFQTSLRVDRTFTYRNWQLATYLDLINAVRGVNPEFTNYAYDYSEYAYVRGLPFIPNLGIEAKFWP